jgi:hypothetical protein
VSAAAAVMKVGSQPRQQQQQQQQRKLVPVQTQQQQQRRSRKSPVKVSTKDCCSSSTQQPAATSTSSSGLSQYMLLEPLTVHGVPQSAARKASSCASDEFSRSPRAAAAASCSGYAACCCPSAAANQAPSNSVHAAAVHLQRSAAEQLHYQQLMLRQDNLLGPAAFARGQIAPRPGSPPPVVLDGERAATLVHANNCSGRQLQTGSHLAYRISCCQPLMHVQPKMMLRVCLWGTS